MLDIQLLRSDLAGVAERLKTRGFALDTGAIESLEFERKDIQTRTQELQSKRNAASKQIGAAKGRGEDTSAVRAQVSGMGAELDAAEQQLASVQERLRGLLLAIPNLPDASVPVGQSEADNV